MTVNIFHSSATQKFTADGIPTDIAVKVAPHLEPITTPAGLNLNSNTNWPGLKMKEKQALEEENMAVIERVYHRLRDDNEIQVHIRQIRAHQWVKTIEGV